jgi:D-sedoheptulose 7-phosphate isomerase
MASSAEEIRRQLEESARVKQSVSDELVGRIAQFAEKSVAALRAGGKIVFFGNGGSAADAMHLAAGNDYGFERIFSRQIESLLAPQEVLVARSTSGNSPNILRGVEAGRARGAFIVAFTGETGGQSWRQSGSTPECSLKRSPTHPGSAHRHWPHLLQPD